MSLLRAWFLGTGALIGGALIWAYVPILVPVIAVTVGLGVLVAIIVAAARRLERSRGRR